MADGAAANGSGPQPHRENTVTDSLGLVTSMETYKERLPRRRKKASDGCWNLTCYSWLFLLLALLQVVVVTGIQIAIAVLGEFRGDRLQQYVGCLEASLRAIMTPDNDVNATPPTFSLPDNFTYPSFGRDKEIYIYFFIAVVLYNFVLCFYALKFQNIVEVYMFMVINVLAMAYACLQVFQFRGFGPLCDKVTLVGYLALANVLVLFIFTFVFGFLSLFIYVEFGWKTYVLVDCNPGMRYYYRVYQVFMSFLKLLLLFLVIFSVIQDVLILQTDDVEFYLTILLGLAAIAALPVVYLIVTFEFLLGAIGLLLTALALIAYYVFKIYRYATRNCPVCKDRVAEVEMDLGIIRDLFKENEAIVGLFDRAQEFQNLLLFGVASLVITLITLVVFIHYWRQFGKGLKGYFGKKRINRWIIRRFCCWCEKWASGTSDTTTSREEADGGKRHVIFLSLGRKKKRSNLTNESTKSTRLEQSTYSPVTEPEFGLVLPTSSKQHTVQ